jgi:hypothetical protein
MRSIKEDAMRQISNRILMVLAISLLSTHFAIAQPPTGDSVRAEVVLAKVFGDDVVLAADRKPHQFIGDFNGDTANDLVAIVKLKVDRSALPKYVMVLNPWGHESAASDRKSNLALLIIHGSHNGWDPNPSTWFLLTDHEFFATPIWESPGGTGLIGLTKRSRASRARIKARGDTITVATEAGIDTTLYWDGKTYRLDAPNEVP